MQKSDLQKEITSWQGEIAKHKKELPKKTKPVEKSDDEHIAKLLANVDDAAMEKWAYSS